MGLTSAQESDIVQVGSREAPGFDGERDPAPERSIGSIELVADLMASSCSRSRTLGLTALAVMPMHEPAAGPLSPLLVDLAAGAA